MKKYYYAVINLNYPASCYLHFWFTSRPAGNDLAGLVVDSWRHYGGDIEKYRLYQYPTKKAWEEARSAAAARVTDWNRIP